MEKNRQREREKKRERVRVGFSRPGSDRVRTIRPRSEVADRGQIGNGKGQIELKKLTKALHPHN
jgi:hypothetical protein